MSSLLWHLREVRGMDVRMIAAPGGDEVPPELARFLADDIGSPKLIIRDMRDSGDDEMASLERTAPVCVIDDRGAGRERAAYAVDIMPHPDGLAGAIQGPFLFGHTFLRSIQSLDERVVKTRADFVVYAGALDDEGTARLLSRFPAKTSLYVLGNGLPMYFSGDGSKKLAEESYAEMLLSSRVAVTHFGVFLYEAAISGCGLVTFNPSAYHSALAYLAQRDMPLINAGVFGELDAEAISMALECALRKAERREVRSNEVEARVMEGLERFADLIMKMV